MQKIVEFTRQEMYEKVWGKPILQLAKESGVSDVAVSKACRRAAIPLPPRGYWAMPESKRPRRPKLGYAPEQYNQSIRFSVLDPAMVQRIQPRASAAINLASDAQAIPADLASPHPLIAKAFAQARLGLVQEGRCVLDGALDVRVSPKQIDRALLYMDSLIKSTEALGAKWSISNKQTRILLHGADIPVTLREVLRREEVKRPNPTPPPRLRSDTWYSNANNFITEIIFVSTGRLSLDVEAYADVPIRKNWKDTSATSIEQKLGDLLITPPKTALAVKDREDRFRRQEDAEREEQRIAAEMARIKQINSLRLNRLFQLIESQARAQQIRALCDQVKCKLPSLKASQTEDVKKWMEWVLSQADELDPLVGNITAWATPSHDVPEHFELDEALESSNEEE
ncbi:hypothetical protein PRJ39_08830 [Lysobacter enzymogenes]|uniref:hypothetical protein n=1 Tax=Lysobacter enzymogenes TaxID=69 RepID=UPI003747EE1D